VKTSGNRLRRLFEYRLVPYSRDWRIRIGELGRHSEVIEEEMTIRLHSDLN
jgi:hypothetical protein